MARRIKNAFAIWACSLLLGCFTLGPTVEVKAIIVKSGTPIEIVEQTEVECRVLQPDGSTDIFEQDVGGWITMHPDHWASLKAEVERLRKKAGEGDK